MASLAKRAAEVTGKLGYTDVNFTSSLLSNILKIAGDPLREYK
jgi:hypothetical protein